RRRGGRGQPSQQLPQPVHQDHPGILLRGPAGEVAGEVQEKVRAASGSLARVWSVVKPAICRSTGVLLAVGVTFLLAAGSEVHAEVSRFVIPSVAPTRTDGTSYAFIAPNLNTDQDHDLTSPV